MIETAEQQDKKKPAESANAIKKLWAAFRRTGVAGQIMSLLIVMAVFTIGTGGQYLSPTNLRTILGLAAIPAIIAVGVHQVVVLGGIDLSVQGIIALCDVVVGLLLGSTLAPRIGLWIIPICLAVGGIAGFLSGVLNVRLKIPSFISTLGISWVLWGAAVFISQGQATPVPAIGLQFLIVGSLFGIPNLAILTVLIVILLQIIQDRTQFGKYLYAIGGDEILARQAGVNVERTKTIVFVIGGLFFGLAALFLALRLGSAQARTGDGLLFPAITAVAVGGVALTGGIGGAKNAALGALIVTALNDGLVLMHVNPYAQNAVNGLVLIAAVALTIDRKKLGFIK